MNSYLIFVCIFFPQNLQKKPYLFSSKAVLGLPVHTTAFVKLTNVTIFTFFTKENNLEKFNVDELLVRILSKNSF
jgi:hypothetical protein